MSADMEQDIAHEKQYVRCCEDESCSVDSGRDVGSDKWEPLGPDDNQPIVEPMRAAIEKEVADMNRHEKDLTDCSKRWTPWSLTDIIHALSKMKIFSSESNGVDFGCAGDSAPPWWDEDKARTRVNLLLNSSIIALGKMNVISGESNRIDFGCPGDSEPPWWDAWWNFLQIFSLRENTDGYLDYRKERDRTASYASAPHRCGNQALECARAGLSNTGYKYSCRDWDWQLKQNHEELHRENSPQCPAALGTNSDGNEKVPQPNTEAPELHFADPTGIEQVIVTAKFPDYASEENRMRSFEYWSPSFNQSKVVLVECGFIYLGDEDAVRCFHCGGGLRNWEPSDDPWREHARWFPRCGYLQKRKGIAFVKKSYLESGNGASAHGQFSDLHLRHHRAALERRAPPSRPPVTERFPNGLDEPGLMNTGLQHRFQPREIRARMNTTAVRRLMDMGYSPVIIRFVIVHQLHDTGADFPTMHDLVSAVWDLEPVVEQFGEAYLEDILKSKFDLDRLPNVLNVPDTIDETYTPMRFPAVVSRDSPPSVTVNRRRRGRRRVAATTLPTSSLLSQANVQRESQTQRLEAAVSRVSNPGITNSVSTGAVAAAASEVRNSTVTSRSRGENARKKKSSDAYQSSAGEESNASSEGYTEVERALPNNTVTMAQLDEVRVVTALRSEVNHPVGSKLNFHHYNPCKGENCSVDPNCEKCENVDFRSDVDSDKQEHPGSDYNQPVVEERRADTEKDLAHKNQYVGSEEVSVVTTVPIDAVNDTFRTGHNFHYNPCCEVGNCEVDFGSDVHSDKWELPGLDDNRSFVEAMGAAIEPEIAHMHGHEEDLTDCGNIFHTLSQKKSLGESNGIDFGGDDDSDKREPHHWWDENRTRTRLNSLVDSSFPPPEDVANVHDKDDFQYENDVSNRCGKQCTPGQDRNILRKLSEMNIIPSTSFRPCSADYIVAPVRRSEEVDDVVIASTSRRKDPPLNILPTIVYLDYRKERDRSASYVSAPRRSGNHALECARAGLFNTGYKDTASCYMCPFRHWDWKPEQNPEKLHRENSPQCPAALGTNSENVPYEPNMASLTPSGSQRIVGVLQSLIPLHEKLDRNTMLAKQAHEKETAILQRIVIKNSFLANYYQRIVTLSMTRNSVNTDKEEGYSMTNTEAPVEPSPVTSTKFIYYTMEDARAVIPRSVQHIVDPKSTVATKSGVPDELRAERARLQSFMRWPDTSTKLDPVLFARSGFFYTGQSREIKCAFCGGTLAVPPPSSFGRFKIAARHKRSFPTCPFVLQFEVGNVPYKIDGNEKVPQPNTEAPELRFADPTGIEQVIVTVKFPEYASEENRMRSFEYWSPSFNQSKVVLVDCGFICLGDDDDAVRCFHCGGGLRSWEPSDDPWREHARWFPRCGFLQMRKGVAFVKKSYLESGNGASAHGQFSDVHLRHHRAALERRDPPTRPPVTERFPNGLDEPGLMNTGLQHRFQPREIRARMDTTAVRRLMDMGYSPVIIRFVIVHQLHDTGADFPTMHDLFSAVLDLEPVVEQYGDIYLEDILMIKFDLDRLPNVLNVLDTIDEAYTPMRFHTVDVSRNPPPSGTRHITSEAPSAATTLPTSSSVSQANVQRESQTQRLEAAVIRVSNQGKTNSVSTGAVTAAASEVRNSTVTSRSRGKNARKKKSSDANQRSAGEGSSASSEDPASMLAEENQRLREQNTCKICMDKAISVVFIPCGHLTACIDCSRTMTECPICRKTIRKKVKTYLP